MKILFTADWHIKLGQKNVPVQWSIDRYFSFFRQLSEIECDLHIIGGDLFDRTPTLEELELYFNFIEDVKVPTIIFDGNHEATKKNKTFFSNLSIVTRRVNSQVNICTSPKIYDSYSILPYCDLHKKGSIEAMPKDRPLFTHVRGEIPPHVTPEVDLERFSDFPVVFAGDLHAHSNSQRNIVYPGSPMTTGFHRNEVSTGYLLIDSDDFSWEWKPFELPQLLRLTVSSPEDMVQTDYHHTIYELEGDLQDLANVSNSELLDKKVVKRSSETSLMLEKSMSVEEELAEYLTYILELPEEKVSSIIGTFNDYSQGVEME